MGFLRPAHRSGGQPFKILQRTEEQERQLGEADSNGLLIGREDKTYRTTCRPIYALRGRTEHPGDRDELLLTGRSFAKEGGYRLR